MSKFEKGDKVLVSGRYLGDDERPWFGGEHGAVAIESPDYDGANLCAPLKDIQPDPGVPVACLVEEADLAAELVDAAEEGLFQYGLPTRVEYKRYRDAREVATKPQYTEGQEVWLKARIRKTSPEGETFAHLIDTRGGGNWADVSYHDIRTEKP